MKSRLSAVEFEKLVAEALPFEANEDQWKAIRGITDFIYSQDERSLFVLKGYAGTGKTNLISAFTRVLPFIKWKSVLLAPTGRAAKVISSCSQKEAYTIHKKIFRKVMGENGSVYFSLAENLHRNTLFVVDEASMISATEQSEGFFNNLLESLFEYVYSGENCRLILVGDTAQLPPVGNEESPALDITWLKTAFHLSIGTFELKQVARQQLESSILLNATKLRIALHEQEFLMPQLEPGHDFIRVTGEELEDALQNAIREYGEENVMIVTRSNKRANLFNQNYRNRIKLYEYDLCAGDKLMVVKNNYFWLQQNENSFIANGEMLELMKISGREALYGFDFADCEVRFCDNESLPVQRVKIITNSLYSDFPSLSAEEQRQLYERVMEDVADVSIKSARTNYLRSSEYFNALQVKFSYAVTCHKSQGGQWPVVFIDQGFLKEDDINRSFIRWLYTAVTRARSKVYLVNFNPVFFN